MDESRMPGVWNRHRDTGARWDNYGAYCNVVMEARAGVVRVSDGSGTYEWFGEDDLDRDLAVAAEEWWESEHAGERP